MPCTEMHIHVCVMSLVVPGDSHSSKMRFCEKFTCLFSRSFPFTYCWPSSTKPVSSKTKGEEKGSEGVRSPLVFELLDLSNFAGWARGRGPSGSPRRAAAAPPAPAPPGGPCQRRRAAPGAALYNAAAGRAKPSRGGGTGGGLSPRWPPGRPGRGRSGRRTSGEEQPRRPCSGAARGGRRGGEWGAGLRRCPDTGGERGTGLRGAPRAAVTVRRHGPPAAQGSPVTAPRQQLPGDSFHRAPFSSGPKGAPARRRLATLPRRCRALLPGLGADTFRQRAVAAARTPVRFVTACLCSAHLSKVP